VKRSALGHFASPANAECLLGATSQEITLIIDFVSLSQALVVLDHGSFSRAAKTLAVRQSAVSRRIASLENELGVSLFERHSDGIRPTIAGRRFLERARAALLEIDAAVKNASAAGRGDQGTIRIGLLPSEDWKFIFDVVCAFRDRHPAVYFEFIENSPRQLISGISGRSLDVAILTDNIGAPGCDTERLWEAQIGVALPATHPLSVCEAIEWELLKDECFLFGMEARARELDRHALENLKRFRGHATLATYEISQDLLLTLVARGFGVTLITLPGTDVSIPGVNIRPMAGHAERFSFCAIWLPRNDNPAMRRFLSLVRSTLRERSKALELGQRGDASSALCGMPDHLQ
jgi:DNA-binding transcriptional LysR family regulator